MKTNPDSDGEYTDAEPKNGAAAPIADEAQDEGEYTDSDAPGESTP